MCTISICEACLHRTTRQLGHSISMPESEKGHMQKPPSVKKRNQPETMTNFSGDFVLFTLSPKQGFWVAVSDGLAKLDGGKIFPTVTLTFDASTVTTANELKVPCLFDVRTSDYERRPALDGAFQLHDQPGHLVLFIPIENQAEKVMQYIVEARR